MEKRMELNLLLDFYGPLLTEARAKILQLYCEEDMSLQEIADALKITRQAVHDAVNRATEQLEDYERKLGMIARYRKIHIEMSAAIASLRDVCATGDTQDALDEALEKLGNIQWIEG